MQDRLLEVLLIWTMLPLACSAAPVNADELDLAAIPGPWENHSVALPDRVVDPESGATSDLSMHYLAAGPVDAPRVVLLHGFPDLAYSWRDVIPLLSDDFRVIAPVEVPVLLLTGKLDPYLMWQMAEASCDHVEPGPCEVEIFENASHFVQWEDPAGLSHRWREFVEGLTAP